VSCCLHLVNLLTTCRVTTDEDVELLERLKDRRTAAESVYNALRRAEQAANAAAKVRRPTLRQQPCTWAAAAN